MINYADGRKIEQRYDAAGNLLFRWMIGSGSYFQAYIYGTEYRGSTIESVAHQEGRLYNTNVGSNTATWRYEYNISDHLGNTRLTFADKTPDGIIKIEEGEVLEEAHYYPFGLAMEGPWINDAAALDTRYKFNGIERVQDFGLNMDMAMYRSYDPAIGRWWQADPVVKPWENPYAAMYNNPMNWSDFEGADATPGGMMSSSKQDSVPTKDWTTSHIPKFNFYVGAGNINIAPPGFINNSNTTSPPMAILTNGNSYQRPSSFWDEEVGSGEGLIPIWGSGRMAIRDFRDGKIGWGIFNTGVAISDVFLVKSLAVAAGKASAGVLFKTGSHSWGATRSWMARKGMAKKGQEIHHVVIQQKGPIGKHIPNKIKNQPWNLKGMPEDLRIHDAIHGKGPLKNRQLFYMYWYSPDWIKGVIGYPGRFFEPKQKK